MKITAPDRYAVFGNPITHSKSPLIHRLFAEQTGESVVYEALSAPVDGFADALATFKASGARGCNITVPFKQDAWQLADERSDYAQRAGAVNTLVLRDDGSVYGANTDGIGIVRDLQQNHQINVQGKRILLLGAGGAVRGVLQPLLEAHPAALFIANRTASKAEALAADFSEFNTLSTQCDAIPIQGGGFEAVAEQGTFDLIINGTAASLQGDVPPIPVACLAGQACCYDMMYAAEPTAFVAWGLQHGAKAMDGLGMLVEQAAESFFIWRGVRSDTRPVLDAVRATLKA